MKVTSHVSGMDFREALGNTHDYAYSVHTLIISKKSLRHLTKAQLKQI